MSSFLPSQTKAVLSHQRLNFPAYTQDRTFTNQIMYDSNLSLVSESVCVCSYVLLSVPVFMKWEECLEMM